MLIGKPAWVHMNNVIGVLYKITQCKDWPDAIPKDDPEIVTPELADFFNKVFVKDAEKRLSAAEVLQHPFITGKSLTSC
jgi:hypothetical protein